MLREHTGDRREHSRFVGYGKDDVVADERVLRGPDVRHPRVTGTERRTPTGHDVASDLDDVARYRGSRGRASRPSAEEHELADVLALDEDRVEHIPHRRERVRLRQHRGVHPRRDAPVPALRDRHQLHLVSEVVRGADVAGGHPRDALPRDVGRDDRGPECEGCQDRQFGGSVVAVDVGRRVGFRIAEGIGFGEGFLE